MTRTTSDSEFWRAMERLIADSEIVIERAKGTRHPEHPQIIYPLDVERMQIEAQDLVGTHDFAAFAASGSGVKDTVRTIYRAEVTASGSEIRLIVEGSGFLYNMVRIIAGTLIGVGSGKLEPGAFKRAIASGDRLDLGVTAPAHGLTLMEVFYDPEDLRI